MKKESEKKPGNWKKGQGWRKINYKKSVGNVMPERRKNEEKLKEGKEEETKRLGGGKRIKKSTRVENRN